MQFNLHWNNETENSYLTVFTILLDNMIMTLSVMSLLKEGITNAFMNENIAVISATHILNQFTQVFSFYRLNQA